MVFKLASHSERKIWALTYRSDEGQPAQLTKGDGPWLGLHYYPRGEMRRSEVEGDDSSVRAYSRLECWRSEYSIYIDIASLRLASPSKTSVGQKYC